MQNRLVSINVCEPDDRRAAAYQRLTQAVKEGSAPSLTIDELQMLCRDVEAAAKDSLLTEWCLRCMWSLLSTSKADETVRAMAYRALSDNDARCRFMDFNYLSHNYPDEARALYEQHVNDLDAELLYSLAWFIMGFSVVPWARLVRLVSLSSCPELERSERHVRDDNPASRSR